MAGGGEGLSANSLCTQALTNLLSLSLLLFLFLSPRSPLSSAQVLKRSPTRGLATVRAHSIHQPQIRWLALVASHIRQFDSFTRLPEMSLSFTWLRNKSSPSWGNLSHPPCWFCEAENACYSAPDGCLCWGHLGAAGGMKFRALYIFRKSILHLLPMYMGNRGLVEWWKGRKG